MVVLTALALEYEAMRAQLDGIRRAVFDGTVFETGVLLGSDQRVALAEVGPGNRPTAVVTERARHELRPRAVLFVGVAGGLKGSVALGDVVVASKVYAYEGAKHTPDGAFARPMCWPASHGLSQIARHALRGGAWRERIPPAVRRTEPQVVPCVHIKPIAAGEVVLNARDCPLRLQLDRIFDDAVAIEMESAGLAEAADLGGLDALTVRGISDHADGQKASVDSQGWQPIAAAHAAAAAAAVIAALPSADGADTGVRAADGRDPRAADPGEDRRGSGGRTQLNTAWDGGTVNAVQDGSLTIRQVLSGNDRREQRR
ncbi:5'-methylthioadenosine/S-adenosylhomocysteine nucleosidase family protein [Streptomyces netropsis]